MRKPWKPVILGDVLGFLLSLSIVWRMRRVILRGVITVRMRTQGVQRILAVMRFYAKGLRWCLLEGREPFMGLYKDFKRGRVRVQQRFMKMWLVLLQVRLRTVHLKTIRLVKSLEELAVDCFVTEVVVRRWDEFAQSQR
jgi:hypothetical protein